MNVDLWKNFIFLVKKLGKFSRDEVEYDYFFLYFCRLICKNWA